VSRPPDSRPPFPSRREVLDGLSTELDAAGIESSRAEAERLLSLALGLSRTELLLHADTALGPEAARRVAQAARRRISGVPLQHIEGTVSFRDLVLVSDGRALIPRPETEQLVSLVAEWARTRARARESASTGIVRVRRPGDAPTPELESALDIGTGSGAIALSLVHEGIAREAVGVDVSPDALSQADDNRRRAGLENSVSFRAVAGSLWDSVGPGVRFDVIVSNPPYVGTSEISGLPVDVRDHEPHDALDGGADGLDVVREIASRARHHLREGGALFLEIGAEQSQAARNIIERAGSWTSVEIASDLTGLDRFVIAIA
jgi:release factor glutamine methyltransferase